MVDGYPARPSVRAGEVLRFHVSTRADRFRADFYRCGARPRLMGSTEQPGRYAPPGRHDEDWRWPGYDFPVPGEWPSGVYIAVFGPAADAPPAAPATAPPPAGAEELDARHSRMLFVVTAREPAGTARILYKVPVSTYHAYNRSGGASLYGALPYDEPYRTVTLRRPGGGIGGPVKGRPDAHDPRTPRQTFAHWDAPFISWLEAAGFTADYCTDLDLHDTALAADGYRLLLSAGHDEYWSAGTRRHTTAFRDQGGNLAVFGANTCWWRITPTADGTAVSCAKYPPGIPQGADTDLMRGAPDHWWETEPENALIGVSYRNGGGHWDGPRAPSATPSSTPGTRSSPVQDCATATSSEPNTPSWATNATAPPTAAPPTERRSPPGRTAHPPPSRSWAWPTSPPPRTPAGTPPPGRTPTRPGPRPSGSTPAAAPSSTRPPPTGHACWPSTLGYAPSPAT